MTPTKKDSHVIIQWINNSFSMYVRAVTVLLNIKCGTVIPGLIFNKHDRGILILAIIHVCINAYVNTM